MSVPEPRPTIPMPPTITITWEWIDVPRAQQLKADNLETNRKKRPAWVSTIALAMKFGEWFPTHHAIAIDQFNKVIDGQHRLDAIIESGCGQWLLVARNVPRESIVAMDLHWRRRACDQVQMMDDTINPDRNDEAIARAMKLGAYRGPDLDRRLTNTTQLHHFFLEHWAAIRLGRTFSSHSKGTRSAVIRGCVANASYYYTDHGRLRRFLEVFATGLPDGPKEHAAIHFRSWVEDPKNAMAVRSGSSELYLVTVTAIQSFMKGQVGRAPKPAESDPWPLPEDAD